MHAVLVLCPLVVFVEVLAEGAHIHKEDSNLNAFEMLLGDYRLLDCIHTAHRGAVGVPAGYVPRADTLQESDFFRLLSIRWSSHMAGKRA